MKKLINGIVFDKKQVLKTGVLFDEHNEPVIINGIAQRNIKPNEKLFWYGDTLRKK